ncbi:leucine-rich repeat protein [Treponema sp. C6A8]|uniref:leucine-rich repeat protein n=1 Tax=Treponema sp. C6A8 TaxID=1410609 RepID=UPI00048A08F9|nr:leucine-rich repeat protein [Treponema sp. C6A8]
MKLKIRTFLLSLLLISASSCEFDSLLSPDWDQPVKNWFDEYTNTAAIDNYLVQGNIVSETTSPRTVASDKDCTIVLNLRNPQAYTLKFSYAFENAEVSEAAGTISNSVRFIQSADKTKVDLIFSEEFLQKIDNDNIGTKNISGTVSIYEPNSGRSFEPHIIQLRTDTQPPELVYPLFQRSESGGGTYIVCFYMPKVSGTVHENDLHKLYMNGRLYYTYKPAAGGAVASFYEDSAYETKNITDFSNSVMPVYPLVDEPNALTFPTTAPEDAYLPVYIDTGITPSDQETTFTFVLEDDAGLKTTTVISNKAKKLQPPTINASEGSYAADEDTGLHTFTITHNGLATDNSPCGSVTINYIVKKVGETEIFKNGFGSGSVSFNLPKGTYEISATASKSYYATSEAASVSNVKVTRQAFFYVSQTGSDDETLATGAYTAPYRTIQHALKAFTDGDYDADSICDVRVLSDLTTPSGMTPEATKPFILIPSKASATVKIRGYGGVRTIYAAGYPYENYMLAADSGSSKVILENLKFDSKIDSSKSLKGIYLLNGKENEATNCEFYNSKNCGIYIRTAKLKLTNCKIYENGGTEDTNLGYNGAIYINSGSELEMTGCSIYSNNAHNCNGGAIYNSGKLTLSSCTITGNKCGEKLDTDGNSAYDGGAVYNNNDATGLYITGKNQITGNYFADGTTPSNIYLSGNRKIQVTGSLAGSKIGVYKSSAPEVGSPKIFTTGFAENNPNLLPGAVFTCDNNYGVALEGTEAAFAVSSGSMYSATDYKFTLTAYEADKTTAPEGMYKGKPLVLYVAPAVTRKEPAGAPTTLTYYPADRKLYNGTVLESGENKVTWSAALYNGGTQVAGSSTSGGISIGYNLSYITITIPAQTYEDTYTLKVTATYLGIPHEISINLKCDRSAESAATYILGLSNAGTYDIAVEGAVGSGINSTVNGISSDDEGLAKVAKAIRNRPADVYINLDASATTQASSITSYNSGEYFKNCTQLKSIKLPDWMEYVIHDLFNGCTSLESVTLSPNTQWICENAFKDCTKLDSITIPEGITGSDSHGIQAGAFVGCTSLADIYYEGTIAQWEGVNLGNNWNKDVPATVVHCIDGDSPINTLLATPLTLEAIEAGAVVTFSNKASGPVTFKVNGGSAQTIASGTSAEITLSAVGDKVQFFGDNATYTGTSNSNSKISCSKECYVYGNIMSLINSTDFKNEKTLTESYTFYELFMNNSNIKNMNLLLPATTLTDFCYSRMFWACTKLTSAPELPATSLTRFCYESMFQSCKFTKAPELPATSLAESCYRQMFYDCTNLEEIPALPATSLAELCYFNMFNGCTGLTTAPELKATRLAESCCKSMFEGCINLTRAPELKATTLEKTCYSAMFWGCTSLTTAPELPATTLAESCYNSMFYGCTSLTNAPELPATTLTKSCYGYMFNGCTSLTNAPELPAATLADSCYRLMFDGCTSLTNAPTLPATTLAYSCYYSMFSDCTSLTTAPELPATTLADSCYYEMFSGCTSLTTAPELPATTLADYCYRQMFNGCTSLNSVTCLATNISATGCTKDWLEEVASTGTFTKAEGMDDWTSGASGIPSGWTVAGEGSGTNNVSSVTSSLSSMTTSGSVNIEGTITADDFTSLKTALDELKTNNSDVLVELDFSEATFTEIPENAFENCSNIQTIKLPDGLTTIGEESLGGTTNLETIYLPASLTSIGNFNFYSQSGDHNKFTVYYSGTLEQWLGIEMECSPYTYTTSDADTKLYVKENGTDKLIEGEITIDGSKVSRVGNGAFYRNRKITKVTITDGVREIGDNAFEGTNLTEITLPSTMDSIGQFAFEYTKIESITIPEGITILNETFRWCTTLKNIYLPNSLREITSQTFDSYLDWETVEGNTTGWKNTYTNEIVELTAEYLRTNGEDRFIKE